MKRIALAFLVGLTLFGVVKAGETEDIQFEQYVEACKNHLDDGQSIVADKKYRVIILTMPIAFHYQDATPEVIRGMQREAIKNMGEEKADVRIIKSLKINMVFNFITIDKKIVPITVSYRDL